MDNGRRLAETPLRDSSFVLFIFQVLTLFLISLISMISLALNLGDQRLWLALLSMALGCLLPSPKISNNSNNSNTAI